MKSKTSLLILVLLVLIAGILIYQNKNNKESSIGTISGQVSIGPLCPVEPCPGTPPNPYTSRQIILKPKFSSAIYVNLESNGSFRADIPIGTYTVSLSDCDFLGCQYNPPQTVSIRSGEISEINIDIDTGIR